MEGEFVDEDRLLFEEAVTADTLYPLHTLGDNFPTDGQQASLAYIQSNRVVTYLFETYGPTKMADLLQAFQRGNDDDQALREVYGFDTVALDNEWRESLGLPTPQLTPTPTPTTIPTIALVKPISPTEPTPLSATTAAQASTPTPQPTRTPTVSPTPPITSPPPASTLGGVESGLILLALILTGGIGGSLIWFRWRR
jgi:hypothetical protein